VETQNNFIINYPLRFSGVQIGNKTRRGVLRFGENAFLNSMNYVKLKAKLGNHHVKTDEV
jgi:hypothetical protein